MSDFFKLEQKPDSPISLVYIEDRHTNRICIGCVKELSNINSGYAAGLGSYTDYLEKVPFEIRSVYGFIRQNEACKYLYKLYIVFGKINNALNKRYETYGLMAANNFALDGSTLNGTDGEQTIAKFVAPGATRSLWVGMRYKF